MDEIIQLWTHFQNQEKFPPDLVRTIRNDPNMKSKLKAFKDYYVLRGDELIEFNWLIGTQLNISVNEL